MSEFLEPETLGPKAHYVTKMVIFAKLLPIFRRIEPAKFKPLPIKIKVFQRFMNSDKEGLFKYERSKYFLNRTRKEVRPDKNAAGISNIAWVTCVRVVIQTITFSSTL